MRITSLYVKIFGWFWFTVVVGSMLVLSFAVFSGAQPLGRRWMRLTQDRYAHSAIDFYVTGGPQGLRGYLATLQVSSGMEGRLLDANGFDVLGAGVPAGVGPVLTESHETGESAIHLGRLWTAATPVSYEGKSYTFVIEVHPLDGFIDGTFAKPVLGRTAVALLLAALFCGLLTRHIVAPVRALQEAALHLAAGDLSSRASPAILPRDDELADTARAFDQMADRIQTLIESRQMLLADISHELRSPLTRVSVSLELMRRGETDVLEQMQVDLDRMNEMIEQILLLTRIDLEITPDMGLVAIEDMLASIVEDAAFEGQATGKNVVLVAEQGFATCTVRGDAQMLRSCIENVVRNAIRYTPDHHMVAVLAGSSQGGCCIVIEDEGPGVPENALERLFEPFYRISESRDRGEGGSGLGLAIAQRIATLHGGSIGAQNRKDGSGLRVTILLPSR